MGYGTRGTHGQITTFEPDNTETDMYLSYSTDLQTIWDQIKAKWPEAEMEDIMIEAEYIHTDCLTYDSYDSSDYTNYLHIMYRPLAVATATAAPV